VSISKAYGKFLRKENLREISVQGCDILIGTPGRLLDFFQKREMGVSLLELDDLKMVVLDEADQLLEDRFTCVLREISKQPGWPKVRLQPILTIINHKIQCEDRQTLLFSATFPTEVQIWANDWLKKANVMVSNRKLVDANTRVMQKFIKVRGQEEKNEQLLKLLKAETEEAVKEDREWMEWDEKQA
jgi:ATP-dependent RNA helicase DDX3X